MFRIERVDGGNLGQFEVFSSFCRCSTRLTFPVISLQLTLLDSTSFVTVLLYTRVVPTLISPKPETAAVPETLWLDAVHLLSFASLLHFFHPFSVHSSLRQILSVALTFDASLLHTFNAKSRAADIRG